MSFEVIITIKKLGEKRICVLLDNYDLRTQNSYILFELLYIF